MGQILSDLRKTGKANKDSQYPSALNEKFQRMTSSEEKLIFQSSSIATSSETSHVIQEIKK